MKKIFAFIVLFLSLSGNVSAESPTSLIDSIDVNSTESTVKSVKDIFKIDEQNWEFILEEEEFANKITQHYMFKFNDLNKELPLSVTVLDDGKGKPDAIIFHHLSYDDVIETMDTIGVPLTLSLHSVLEDNLPTSIDFVEYKGFLIKLSNTHKFYKENKLDVLINGENHYTLQIGISDSVIEFMKGAE